MKTELIKQFDIKASSLGLDGEQMDEMREFLRQAITQNTKSIVERLEKLKREPVTGGYEGEQEMNIEIATHNNTLSDIISSIKEQ